MINGKFAAGLAVIGLVLTFIVAVIAVFGIIRLGIVPSAEEVLRITFWVIVTFLYVALWLAFGLLLSVLIRRAATSALVAFGTWLLLTFFGGLITQLVGGFIAPVTGTVDQQAARRTCRCSRRSPGSCRTRCSGEASLAILNPQVSAVTQPATIGGYQQAAQRIPSLQAFDQSLLLVWPHMVTMVAVTVPVLRHRVCPLHATGSPRLREWRDFRLSRRNDADAPRCRLRSSLTTIRGRSLRSSAAPCQPRAPPRRTQSLRARLSRRNDAAKRRLAACGRPSDRCAPGRALRRAAADRLPETWLSAAAVLGKRANRGPKGGFGPAPTVRAS